MKYLIIFFLSTVCRANWADLPAEQFALPPPPSQNSPAFKEDFKILHEWQNSRSTADCKLGESQSWPKFQTLFIDTSDILNAAESERAKPILEKVTKLTEKISTYWKEKYQRPRPYETDPTIQPCAFKPGGKKSYPSSHSAIGVASACVLGKLFPQKASKLSAWGERIADLRVIIGVHHPSDVKAGKVLGENLCSALLKDPDFLRDLNN